MLASGSSAVALVTRGPRRPAAVLGVTTGALYLDARDAVLAVLTADAARLPCGIVLPQPAAQFSLRQVPPDGFVLVGDGALSWTSGGRPVVVDVVREWRPARVRPVRARADRLEELRAALAPIDLGVPLSASPLALLGRGPGLTPSGDDVLAGYLLGCRALGQPVPSVAGLHRTTALSAALLRHAFVGECVPEVAALVSALAGDAPLPIDALLRVGATSGAALAAGVLLASAAPATRPERVAVG